MTCIIAFKVYVFMNLFYANALAGFLLFFASLEIFLNLVIKRSIKFATCNGQRGNWPMNGYVIIKYNEKINVICLFINLHMIW